MKLLLDTHTLIWLLDQVEGGSLGRLAHKHMSEAEVLYASSLSVAEIRIKSMLGKLVSQPELLDDIAQAGCTDLPFLSTHADALTKFPQLARHDPFDRMLLAQAVSENARFLTADQFLLSLGLPFVLDAAK